MSGLGKSYSSSVHRRDGAPYKNTRHLLGLRGERVNVLLEDGSGRVKSDAYLKYQADPRPAMDKDHHLDLPKTRAIAYSIKHALFQMGAAERPAISKSSTFSPENIHAIPAAERELYIYRHVYGLTAFMQHEVKAKNGIPALRLRMYTQNLGLNLRNLLVSDLLPEGYRSLKSASYLDRLIIMLKVAINVMALHAHGFIHFDLKPDNIVMDKNGNVYLIDFEGAQLEWQLHVDSRVVTTKRYSAPVISGEKLTAKFDVFSLSRVLLDLLSGCADLLPDMGKVLVDATSRSPDERPNITEYITAILDEIARIKSPGLSVETQSMLFYLPDYLELYNQVIKESSRLLSKNVKCKTGLALAELGVETLNEMQCRTGSTTPSHDRVTHLLRAYQEIADSHSRGWGLFRRTRSTSTFTNCESFIRHFSRKRRFKVVFQQRAVTLASAGSASSGVSPLSSVPIQIIEGEAKPDAAAGVGTGARAMCHVELSGV